jgi:hypothetical protein
MFPVSRDRPAIRAVPRAHAPPRTSGVAPSPSPLPVVDSKVHFCDEQVHHHTAVVTALVDGSVSHLVHLRVPSLGISGWSIPFSHTPRPFTWHWPVAACGADERFG